MINTSKEMMSFSDFLIPKEFPPFMHNTQVRRRRRPLPTAAAARGRENASAELWRVLRAQTCACAAAAADVMARGMTAFA